MIMDDKNRHYTTIKNLPRLLKFLIASYKEAYLFCIDCLDGFFTTSSRDKHYMYCSSNGHAKVKIPSGKEPWLIIHDGHSICEMSRV